MYICARCTCEWVMSTHKWLMSHIGMSHCTHTNEFYQKYEPVMSHVWMSHTWLWATSRIEHDSFYSYMRHDSFLFVILLIQSYVWHESFTYDLFICVTWLITYHHYHVVTRHVTCMNKSCLTYEWVMSHTWMSHCTHTNEFYQTYEPVMSHVWMSHTW